MGQEKLLHMRKVAVFWVVAPCNLVVQRRFSVSCWLRHQGLRGGRGNSETSVNFYQTTRCCSAEGGHLHTRRGENLSSYLLQTISLDLKYPEKSHKEKGFREGLFPW
jgi:hypothetical protein